MRDPRPERSRWTAAPGVRWPLGMFWISVLGLGHTTALVAQSPGTIEGTVTLRTVAPKRTASRYPAGGRSVREMQPVPAVVYITGDGLSSPSADATVDVAQRDTVFAPAALAVQAGTVVRFLNADPFFHNVFSYDRNARFDLGRYPQGEARERVFEEPGVARVFCEVHEFMRAVVVVTDHPYHAVVGDDGSFRLEGVPPGDYTITAFQSDLGAVDARLSVPAGGTARVELQLGD